MDSRAAVGHETPSYSLANIVARESCVKWQERNLLVDPNDLLVFHLVFPFESSQNLENLKPKDPVITTSPIFSRAQYHLRLGFPRLCPPHHSSFPATDSELDQSICLCPYSPNIEPFPPDSLTVRKAYSSRPRFTIDCPYSTTSSRLAIERLNSYLSHQILCPLSYRDHTFPDFPPSVYSRKKLHHSMAAFRSSRTRFFVHTQHMGGKCNTHIRRP